MFTTRPDTLFGATYMVIAPEHPAADGVRAYQAQAAAQTAEERQAEAGAKSGVFTGAYAVNPVNGQSLPICVADYVVTGYGTGAIMAVPAHDARDHAFATAFELPIVEVVSHPTASRSPSGPGTEWPSAQPTMRSP